MASLVPLAASGLKAYYSPLTKTFKLVATGPIPGVVLSAFLQRDTWLGGLKFSLVGYYGGLGKPPPKELNTQIEEYIALPKSHFQSRTVLVETASGTYTIKIQYELEGFDSSDTNNSAAAPDQAGNDVASTVLPPIKEYLPGGDHLLTITARIPTDVPLYNIDTKFNEEYLRIENVAVSDGQVTWRFKWEKFPVEEANPQLLEVITEGFNGVQGPAARRFTVIQGYIVHGVVLK